VVALLDVPVIELNEVLVSEGVVVVAEEVVVVVEEERTT